MLALGAGVYVNEGFFSIMLPDVVISPSSAFLSGCRSMEKSTAGD